MTLETERILICIQKYSRENKINLRVYHGGKRTYCRENIEGLVVASKEIGLEVNAVKSTWSCLEIRMQEKVTVYRMIFPLKRWKISNTWKQP